MFLKKFVCGPIQNNVLLLACEITKKAAVIDPAIDSFSKLQPVLEKEKFSLEKVLLTHSHWDHIAEVKLFQDTYLAKVYVHRQDALNLEYPGSDRLSMGALPPVKPDYFLEDKQHLQVGKLDLLTLHTPGHTPGGVCFYMQSQKILFSGDTLFKGSIGRLDLPTSNPDLMWPSLEKLSKLPPDTKVIAGHGEDTTIGKENWLCRAKEIFS